MTNKAQELKFIIHEIIYRLVESIIEVCNGLKTKPRKGISVSDFINFYNDLLIAPRDDFNYINIRKKNVMQRGIVR